jgi:hypothetical protein
MTGCLMHLKIVPGDDREGIKRLMVFYSYSSFGLPIFIDNRSYESRN